MSFGVLVALLYTLHCTSYRSIHSWVIAISGLGKQTSAMLTFYFRFWFRPYHCIGMSFCIRRANFIHIGLSSVELWRCIDFQDGGRWGAILLPVSNWLTSRSSEGVCLYSRSRCCERSSDAFCWRSRNSRAEIVQRRCAQHSFRDRRCKMLSPTLLTSWEIISCSLALCA